MHNSLPPPRLILHSHDSFSFTYCVKGGENIFILKYIVHWTFGSISFVLMYFIHQLEGRGRGRGIWNTKKNKTKTEWKIEKVIKRREKRQSGHHPLHLQNNTHRKQNKTTTQNLWSAQTHAHAHSYNTNQ